MVWKDYIPSKIKELYEVHDFKHATAILSNEFPSEFKEICDALLKFRFTIADVKEAGGNESQIPKKFAKLLRNIDWKERSLTAKIIVDENEISHDTHKVDFIKNRVAFDLEWNSKDQTFDKDLAALKAFFKYDRISAVILVVRSFTKTKTLLKRLAERTVGLPVLVLEITESRPKKKKPSQYSVARVS